ncbi:M1 family metallopeptidase [uncultured Kriegella sp.]|uniref:M1 family metallopeptidase n=1 Tax=uncultured Kriegella sp. TaxID=1798910 RepID=UPI0030DCBC72|tara:strand:+ start:77539 stop:79197 length:1659 start_codon:yes stop_codon:yes gene_type:complete
MKYWKKNIIGVLVFIAYILTPKAAFADNYPKNPNIDVLHYSFDLKLSDATDAIKATATLLVKFKTDGIKTLRLDLIKENTERGSKGMRVTQIISKNTTLNYTHSNDVLLIHFPPSEENEERTISIAYEGIPNDGLKIGPNKYGDRTFFSDNWPNKARNWLPTVDHPYDKATSEFIITAPMRYQVVSNGIKLEETILENGMRLTHWKQSVPIATWLYVLGVAEFAVQYVDSFQGKSIQTWVYKQDRDAGFYDFATPTKHALEFYSDYVGPFAYEKLANIQSNSVNGGMEAASAILYGENSVVGDRNVRWRNVVIHEIAHQWFGNAVTEYDWNDVWLSEGLTTYFTMRFIKHAYGEDAFTAELKKARNIVFKLSKNNEDYRIVHDNLTNMAKVTSGLTYQKGAWITHMICNHIGEEAFQKGIRDYYQQFFNGNATTLDLRMALERASGKDLNKLFDQWLYQGGNIKLKGTWDYDKKEKLITIELKQVQPKNYAFNMPIEIGISHEKNTIQQIETIALDQRSITVSIPSETLPKNIELDPKTKLLAQLEFSQKAQ